MREELVTPATARRLAQVGLLWDPQPGDWVTALGGAHMDEGLVGIWLVVSVGADGQQLTLADATGRWPQSRGVAHDCLWLPSAGKLKVWLRGRGYRIATGEVTARLLAFNNAERLGERRVLRDSERYPAPAALPIVARVANP